MTRDVRRLPERVRQVVLEHDLVVEKVNSGHLRVTDREGRRLAVIASTPSDWRTGLNDAARLRRAIRARG